MNDIDRLLAIEDIRKLKARYCRLLDTKQFDAWEELFTGDADFDVSCYPYAQHPVTGERHPTDYPDEEIEAQVNAVEWPLIGGRAIREFGEASSVGVTTVHHLFSHEIDIVSADEATAIWTMEDLLWMPDAPIPFMHGLGHYHERYRCEDGNWRISHERLTRLRVEWGAGSRPSAAGIAAPLLL